MMSSKNDIDLISHRAEIYRSQLISDFNLLQSISQAGSHTESPILIPGDIIDAEKCQQMMLTRPQALVRFNTTEKVVKKASSSQRRRNRLVNKRKRHPPLDIWANYVISSSWFQLSILILILLNSVVLGIQAEISDINPKSSTVEMSILVLDIFDYCALMCFIIEIFLKWFDNFMGFWMNKWNIFDFVVTFLSVIPEIIKYSSSDSIGGISSDVTVVADNLRTFRVLRSLKMISRFEKVRVIVLAVSKAFHEMVFITLLLFIFAYIFAIVGVTFLNKEEYQDQLTYKNSFSSFPSALITLFQLFTLDHWFDIYKDVRIVSGSMFAALYVILWIVLGSFIIRNIVVGIMVNNFQNIRNEMFDNVGSYMEELNENIEKDQFAKELERQSQKRIEEKSVASLVGEISSSKLDVAEEDHNSTAGLIQLTRSHFASVNDLKDALNQTVDRTVKGSEDWQKIIEKNMEHLQKNEATTCWPRDSLFKYYLLLESLQENIAERQEILAMASECISLVQDK